MSEDLVKAVRVKGTVKWFNSDKGFGFIIADGYNRDIFVHRQQLVRSGIQDLKENELLTFVVQEGQKGMYAISLSKGEPKCQ
jgi:cold shock protein